MQRLRRPLAVLALLAAIPVALAAAPSQLLGGDSGVAAVVVLAGALCGKEVHHGWLAGVAGIGVYVAAAYFGVRRGSAVWAVPLAVVAAVAATLAVSAVLPGTQGICET